MNFRNSSTPIAVAAFLGALAVSTSLAIGPAAAQSKYKESPALAEQVKAGKLPAVDSRLPEQPLVVPVVEKTGQYGGVWRRAFLGPADANNYTGTTASVSQVVQQAVPAITWKPLRPEILMSGGS